MLDLKPMPLTLIHGTSGAVVPDILKYGIKPRGKDGARNNWKHTVGSNAQCVYLSTAYAFHFAINAAKEDADDLALVEVDTMQIYSRLQADEDVLEQAYRGRDKLPTDWTMKRRTIYYRARAHNYSPQASLTAMGTCAARGVVPPDAIRRVCTVAKERLPELVLTAFDPLVCLLNYQILGERHEQFHRWLFNDEPECEANPSLSREGITVQQIKEDDTKAA